MTKVKLGDYVSLHWDEESGVQSIRPTDFSKNEVPCGVVVAVDGEFVNVWSMGPMKPIVYLGAYHD